MEREQTLRILNALANGVHPATGEQFAADSPYQHPDTVRALYAAVRALDAGAVPAPATERRPAPPQSGAGSRWSEEEEQRLVSAFDAGRTIDALAQSRQTMRPDGCRIGVEKKLSRFIASPRLPATIKAVTGLRIHGAKTEFRCMADPRQCFPTLAFERNKLDIRANLKQEMILQHRR